MTLQELVFSLIEAHGASAIRFIFSRLMREPDSEWTTDKIAAIVAEYKAREKAIDLAFEDLDDDDDDGGDDLTSDEAEMD